MSNKPIPEFQPVIMALREQRIIAKPDYWCCQTCGLAAIEARIERCKSRGGEPIGVAFYHHQDRGRYYDDGVLYLTYDATDDGGKTQGEIGEIIAATARNLGWRVVWDGTAQERVMVACTDEVMRRWDDAIRLSGAKDAAACAVRSGGQSS